MQSRTSAGISASLSGISTTNGNSTRQSVASVTCETREKASKRILSARVCLSKEPPRAFALGRELRELPLEALHRLRRGAQQFSDLGVARRIGAIAPLFHFAQPMMHRCDQLARGAWDCRADRPADRDCVPPPRCRPKPRTACAPIGRCAARCAGRRERPRRLRPADESRSRGPPARCSCTEFRANAIPALFRARCRAASVKSATAFMFDRVYAFFR